MLYLTCVTFIVLILPSNRADSDKPVIVRLNSKWNKVSVLVEISEYFAGYKYENYWDFLNLFKSYNLTDIKRCSKHEYEIGLEMANKILTITDDVLKFSLSMSETVPKIQFYNSIAKDKKIPYDCLNVFSMGNEINCNWKWVEDRIGNKNIALLDLDSWDRIYNSTKLNDEAPLVYYYQDLLSPEFPVYHEKLIKLSKDGKIRYVFHGLIKTHCNQLTRLSGFGAILNIKSTDYKAMDDQKIKIPLDTSQEINEYIEKVSTNMFNSVNSTEHRNYNITHPPADLLDNLGLSTLAYIAQGEDARSRLNTLIDVSQNFPTTVNKIPKKNFSRVDNSKYYQFRHAISWNDIEDSSSIYVNGIGIDYEYSPFQLITMLNKEYTILSYLSQLGFSNAESMNLLINSSSTESFSAKVDVRSPNIIWLNDLQKDHRYRYWSKRIEDFLTPLWPGQFHEIGLNVFNLVLFVDTSSPYFFSSVLTFQRLIHNELPIRFGIVPLTPMKDPIFRGISRAFVNLMLHSKRQLSSIFLEKLSQNTNKLTVEEVSNIYKSVVPGSDELLLWLDEHNSDEFLNNANSFYESIGLGNSPIAIFNGHIISTDKIVENFVFNLVEIYRTTLKDLTHQFQSGALDEVTDYEAYFMGGKGYLKKIKSKIITPPSATLSLFQISKTSVNLLDLDNLAKLSPSELNYILFRYGLFINHNATARTFWLVVNLDSVQGIKLLLDALCSNISSSTRIGILLNSLPTASDATITDIVLDVLLNIDSDLKNITITNLLHGYLENSSVIPQYSFKADFIKQRDYIRSHQLLIDRSFRISDSNSYLFYNGRNYGPVSLNNTITQEDINLLITYDEFTFGLFQKAKMKILIGKNSHFQDIGLSRLDLLDSVKCVLSLFKQETRMNIPNIPDHLSEYVIKLEPRNNSPFVNIIAAIDPLSTVCQKWSSLLSTIHSAVNAQITIFLNPSIEYNEFPLRRFYRYALDPTLAFEGEELDHRWSTVVFNALSQDVIFTFSADTLQSWFIEAVYCNCDMDNIYLKNADNSGCIGIYDLEYIMLEGHAFDIEKNAAAANLELTLGPISNPNMFDTIVIYNLGYFQFKAFPGAFLLGLKNSESSKFTIYQIISDNIQKNKVLTIDNYLGKIIRVKVKQRNDVSAPDSGESKKKPQDNWWSSVSSYFSSKPPPSNDANNTINIFSLATGLLYERFMRIMMLSVLKHTNTPVKFWFLKNYVSPQYVKSMSILSKKYKFQYEFVQYQWPHWLIKQTEKQRIIWGYKILFLDVLFPLDVKRIIFVDADQIVRADLNELYTFELGDAPYGYTPFCDDRPEMESFRFWKRGYWKTHLGRRPYHISALYLVDLEKFREMAAGDRLRGQYQALSNDPNSLANLDQDLPNNLQHSVPIKSLPQEWLWCETWCSDSSKVKAKTIDMCNNPLTREAKLDRAIRIAPEFLVYDKIIKDLLNDEYVKDLNDITTLAPPIQTDL